MFMTERVHPRVEAFFAFVRRKASNEFFSLPLSSLKPRRKYIALAVLRMAASVDDGAP
jgi:hypothetical protein